MSKIKLLNNFLMPEEWKQLWANLANLVGIGYRSNAFAPLVWFNSIIDPILIIGAILLKGFICYILISLLCIIIVFSLIMYAILVLKSPNLLTSEKFRIEDKKLDMIAAKGSDIIVNPVDISLQEFIESEKQINDYE